MIDLDKPLKPHNFLPKHYVHNITVVHIDGGEGGIRAAVTPAYSLSRGAWGGYFARKMGG